MVSLPRLVVAAASVRLEEVVIALIRRRSLLRGERCYLPTACIQVAPRLSLSLSLPFLVRLVYMDPKLLHAGSTISIWFVSWCLEGERGKYQTYFSEVEKRRKRSCDDGGRGLLSCERCFAVVQDINNRTAGAAAAQRGAPAHRVPYSFDVGDLEKEEEDWRPPSECHSSGEPVLS